MKYRQVGNSGLRISEVSIGGWITLGGTVDDTHAHAILHTAIERGVNFIDLADVYAGGEAERVTGAAIRDFKRSDLVISSKCYWPMGQGTNDRGLSRKHIMESCEASLRRLGTDYLDIFFCHRFDEHTPLEETARAMEDLIRQGKVLYWGTSVWTADQLGAAQDVAQSGYAPIVEQPRYNLFDRHIEADGVMDACQERGVGLVVWSPLAQGMLTGRYNDGVPKGSRAATTSWLDQRLTAANIEACRKFCVLATEYDYEPAQLALAWILDHPQISSVITGASSPAQVTSNIHATELELSNEILANIADIFAGISWT